MSPFIYVNLTSAVCCFTFVLFLFVSYFTKKNMDNLENKVFRLMLISNMCTTIVYMCSYTSDIIAYKFIENHSLYLVALFFAKLAPPVLFTWYGLLFLYLIIIMNEKNEAFIEKLTKNEKKYLRILYCIFIAIGIIQFLQSFKVNVATGVENTPLFVSILLVPIFLIIIGIILLYGRRLPKRKAMPIFLIVPIAGISLVSGVLGVDIVMLYLIATAIDTLMYHTIENPDMKLISELQLAKSAAEKSNKAKSDFLSSMSHELRTPLNAIVGLSEMITLSTQEEETKQDATDILKASNNLLDLVDGILDINKLDTNQMELVEANYDPLNVFNDLVKLTTVRLGDKPIEIKTHFSEEIPETLFGDKDKVKSVINNLLTNAVKYTENGFIYFNVDCSIEKDKCNLCITVKDTGRGIQEDQMKNLFSRFYRLEEDKDSDIQGTGLGLAITKSIVELFNGKIEVESVFGQGSTFKVVLPQIVIEKAHPIQEQPIKQETTLIETQPIQPPEASQQPVQTTESNTEELI